MRVVVLSGWSPDPEGCQGSLWVACGVAAGCGDVGVVVLAEHTDREVAEACHHAGQAAGAGSGGVLGEGRVADVVELVLDLPMPSDPVGDLSGIRSS